MNQQLERRPMNSHKPSRLLVTFLASVAVIAACNPVSGQLGTVPPASTAPEPSVAQGSPDITPEPSGEPTDQPSTGPTSSDNPGSSQAPAGTTIVRAYFLLGGDEGSAGLTAVLREIPRTTAVARAALN